ncbi:MAG: hypothetical protein FJ147_04050 [Deltaproteobacteria bacterium]|nr:hypothetical protein [Deltaproteobacteria bacterium]
MTTLEFLHRLLECERRVSAVYRTFGNCPTFASELRAFWQQMAEDERRHVFILQRSTTVLDLRAADAQMSPDAFSAIEQQLADAEMLLGQPNISGEEALRQAVLLEGSELNRLSDDWFRSFPPALRALLTGLMPEDNVHLRHLLEAVHAFSVNKVLQEQATALWLQYQRAKARAKAATDARGAGKSQ